MINKYPIVISINANNDRIFYVKKIEFYSGNFIEFVHKIVKKMLY